MGSTIPPQYPQTEVGSTIPPDTQNTLIIFLSAIAVMQLIFLPEDDCAFILLLFFNSAGNSFNCKLKKLINEQTVIFYSPSVALCSSDKYAQITHLKYRTFIGMCTPFTWFNLQIMILSL